jgi:hypothetical protein
VSRSKAAALDPSSGAVITTFGKDSDRINGPVFALACSKGKLFVGGNFTKVNGALRSYCAALDATTGVLDASFDPSPRDSMDIDGKMAGGVWALEVHPENPEVLFVAGNFQTIFDGQDSPFLVALTTDGMPGPSFDRAGNSPVCDLDCKGQRLYAGVGGFGNQVAAYDIGSPDSYTGLWKGFVVEGDVQAVTCSDSGFIYFSFHQGLIDTTDLYRCAVVEAKNGCLYDTFPSISSFLGVWALDVENGYLAAGGIFNDIGGNPHNYLAVFKEPSYTLPVLPQQVVLVDPPDGSIGISSYPKMQWQFAAYAETFDLQAATDERFKHCVVDDSRINDLDKRISGLDRCTHYFWRVRAGNRWGHGPWSAASQFITGPGGGDIPVIVQPPDGAEEQATVFACIWKPTATALSYTLQVSEDRDFMTVLKSETGITDTCALVKGLAHGSRYYVRVKAMTAGGPGDWATASFTTVPASPQMPLATAPADHATQVACSPVLTWRPVVNTVSYRVQLSVDEYFIGTIIDIPAITDTFVTIPKLAGETIYYWRVSAANAGGETWSTPMQFTTEFPSPYSPVALSPFQGSVITGKTVKIIWSGSGPHVTSYRIELSHDPAMASPFVAAVTTDTTYELSGFGDGTEVFWRVKAYNETGAGPFSATAVFTTMLPPPPVFHYSFDRFSVHRGVGSVVYNIAQRCDVHIGLFDLKGRLIWQSVQRDVAPGRHNELMRSPLLTAGAYVLSIRASSFSRKIGVMAAE